MKSRRGISEIVSAMIVIAVVISGLGIYVALSQQRILGESQSVKDAMKSSENQLAEIIEPLVMLKNGTEVSLFVYNYGLKEVTVTEVYVNGTNKMSSLGSTIVRNMIKVDLNGVIPIGKTSEIVLNFTQIKLKHIQNLVIQTDSNRLIDIRNDTN